MYTLATDGRTTVCSRMPLSQVWHTDKLHDCSLISFTALLRTMEYYRGIMFMTTNISARIDPAILNRVHLGLGYDMNQEKRESISRSFFKWYGEKDFVFEKSAEAKFLEFVEEHDFNGREIRNGTMSTFLARYTADVSIT